MALDTPAEQRDSSNYRMALVPFTEIQGLLSRAALFAFRGVQMKLQLPCGRDVFFDESDLEAVSARTWKSIRTSTAMYAISSDNRDDGQVVMHKVLMGAAPEGMVIDHIDGNGLNNQRSNLRFATLSQNQWNRRKRSSGFTSPFKGVWYNSRRDRFIAQIVQFGKQLRLGSFKSEHKAARSYDAAVKDLHGKFGVTNQELGLFDLHPDRQSLNF